MYRCAHTKIIWKKQLPVNFKPRYHTKNLKTHTHIHTEKKKLTVSEIRNHFNIHIHIHTQRQKHIKYQKPIRGRAGLGKPTQRKRERGTLYKPITN